VTRTNTIQNLKKNLKTYNYVYMHVGTVQLQNSQQYKSENQ